MGGWQSKGGGYRGGAGDSWWPTCLVVIRESSTRSKGLQVWGIGVSGERSKAVEVWWGSGRGVDLGVVIGSGGGRREGWHRRLVEESRVSGLVFFFPPSNERGKGEKGNTKGSD